MHPNAHPGALPAYLAHRRTPDHRDRHGPPVVRRPSAHRTRPCRALRRLHDDAPQGALGRHGSWPDRASPRLRQLRARRQADTSAPTRSSGWRPCRMAAACPRRSSSALTTCPNRTTSPISAAPKPPPASAACAASTTSPSRWRKSGSTPPWPPHARASVGIPLQDLCETAEPHITHAEDRVSVATLPGWAPETLRLAARHHDGTCRTAQLRSIRHPGGGLAQLVRSRTARATSLGCPERPKREDDTCATASSDAA
jgi:hypothetical protein